MVISYVVHYVYGPVRIPAAIFGPQYLGRQRRARETNRDRHWNLLTMKSECSVSSPLPFNRLAHHFTPALMFRKSEDTWLGQAVDTDITWNRIVCASSIRNVRPSPLDNVVFYRILGRCKWRWYPSRKVWMTSVISESSNVTHVLSPAAWQVEIVLPAHQRWV